MNIAVLPTAEAGQMLSHELGCDPSSTEGIAELLRHEVSARGRCPRHLTIGRVCRVAEAAVVLDPAQVEEICEILERQGDFVLGDGGVLHTSPVRIVILEDGLCRFVCAIPSRWLRAAVAGEWVTSGTRRDCRTTEAPAAIATALGGVVLSPGAWAGLDRVPIADAMFLKSLDARLEAAPRAAGSLESEGSLRWSTCTFDDGGVRWREISDAGVPGRLWRARNHWRRWVYAWTIGGAPSKLPFIALDGDNGTRAVYALARSAGTPLSVSYERDDGEVRLTIPCWLPVAEYRYVSTLATAMPAGSSGGGWAVPASRFDAVHGTLGTSLGLLFVEAPRK